MQDREEEHLGRRLAAREDGALADVYARYARPTFGFLLNALRDRATAEDVQQQVFLEVWQRAPQFDPARGSLFTWIMLIARSRAIDQLRRRIPIPHDPADSPALETPVDPVVDELVEHWHMVELLERLPHEEARAAAPALLRRTQPERDLIRYGRSTRNREDANGQRTATTARDDGAGGMSTHERESELSAYLLDELGAEERAAFERALAEDAELRAEVERLRPVVARLEALPAEGWEDVPEPPPLRLPDAATAPQPQAERRRRRWLRGPLVVRPAFAALGAAALLVLGIGLGTLIDEDGGSSGAPTVAQRTVPLQPLQSGAAAHGRALVADAGGGAQRVTLRLRGLPPSRARQFYEVWLMDASGPLIAIGSFRVGADGNATVKLPLPVPATRYQYFDISVQPEGDDANHSGDSVLRGATA